MKASRDAEPLEEQCVTCAFLDGQERCGASSHRHVEVAALDLTRTAHVVPAALPEILRKRLTFIASGFIERVMRSAGIPNNNPRYSNRLRESATFVTRLTLGLVMRIVGVELAFIYDHELLPDEKRHGNVTDQSIQRFDDRSSVAS